MSSDIVTVAQGVGNILGFLKHQVTQEHKDAGDVWYEEAHDLAVSISEQFGTDLDVVCAVMSAYSQNTYWESTVKLTIKNLSFYYRYGTVMGMPAQIKTINAILDNNDADLLRGPKLRDFALGIYTRGLSRRPPQDRWMVRVFLGIMDWPGTIGQDLYDASQEAYLIVADELKQQSLPQQAGIWVAALEHGPTRPNIGQGVTI